MTILLLTLCIGLSLATLLKLIIIDIRVRLLPNIYVALFALMGVTFNVLTAFNFSTPENMTLGATAGVLMLYAVRFVANAYYKKDTLGLGDVKLIGAAGIWLGLDSIFLAISIGAFAGIIHGLIYVLITKIKTKKAPALSQLTIPAGPGFIFGIVVTSIFKFYPLIGMSL